MNNNNNNNNRINNNGLSSSLAHIVHEELRSPNSCFSAVMNSVLPSSQRRITQESRIQSTSLLGRPVVFLAPPFPIPSSASQSILQKVKDLQELVSNGKPTEALFECSILQNRPHSPADAMLLEAFNLSLRSIDHDNQLSINDFATNAFYYITNPNSERNENYSLLCIYTGIIVLRLAEFYKSTATIEHAKNLFQNAINIFGQVSQNDPEIHRARFNIGYTYKKLANLNLASNDTISAELAFRSAVLSFIQIPITNKEIDRVRSNLANIYEELGKLQLANNKVLDAEIEFEAAITMFSLIPQYNNKIDPLRLTLASKFLELGKLHATQISTKDEAKKLLGKAVSQLTQIPSSTQSVVYEEVTQMLVSTLSTLNQLL